LENGVDIFDLAHQVDFHVFDGRVVDVGRAFFNEGIHDLVGLEVADLLVKVIHE
jgi:hypothetical protein